MDPRLAVGRRRRARAGRLRRKRRRRQRLRRRPPWSPTSPACRTPTATARSRRSQLVNAWGIAFNPQGFVWVANDGTSTSTLYDGNGVPQSLVVAIPAGAAGEAEPTGIVFNGSNELLGDAEAGMSGASALHLRRRGRHDLPAGRRPSTSTNAIMVVDRAADGDDLQGPRAGAAPGRRRLPVRDRLPQRRASTSSTRPSRWSAQPARSPIRTCPPGYAPFGIQAIGNRIYVSYAKQDAASRGRRHRRRPRRGQRVRHRGRAGQAPDRAPAAG